MTTHMQIKAEKCLYMNIVNDIGLYVYCNWYLEGKFRLLIWMGRPKHHKPLQVQTNINQCKQYYKTPKRHSKPRKSLQTAP